MRYDNYMYLFPPRPIQTTHNTELSKYDNGMFLAQPKYNGDCCNIFINESTLHVMNRHKSPITSNYSDVDFRGMYMATGGNGWLVISGEFLNKNKSGENGQPFNLKFVIWDILVWNGDYLLGTTFLDRVRLLEQLFPCSQMRVSKKEFECYKHLCMTEHKNIFKAPCYDSNFGSLYNSIVETDLYEGLVIKRKDAKLNIGLTEKNNNDWQIKCRKPTKNYNF